MYEPRLVPCSYSMFIPKKVINENGIIRRYPFFINCVLVLLTLPASQLSFCTVTIFFQSCGFRDCNLQASAPSADNATRHDEEQFDVQCVAPKIDVAESEPFSNKVEVIYCPKRLLAQILESYIIVDPIRITLSSRKDSPREV